MGISALCDITKCWLWTTNLGVSVQKREKQDGILLFLGAKVQDRDTLLEHVSKWATEKGHHLLIVMLGDGSSSSRLLGLTLSEECSREKI